ncbi:Protein of unknown function [Eubacterium uniforme]|uniref:DUF4230 domain-containing protein n=1 Tax=Eubacterium uniforme TaxID=39495 RepID=A0A1T4W4L8_9FIRM|nr:DUF4230 domain-containing protein [Eubacterium uniforme]SKA71651.1 Protein of unknown function [Eubacterium uniforme]
MKRVLVFMMVSLLTVSMLSGCGKKKKEISIGDKEPTIESIRNLCELATLKCKFNNVAKAKKTDGSGINSLLKENREFWVDYVGVVEISYNLNDVKMEIEKNNVKITLPECQINTSIDPKSWTDDSYVSDKDNGFKKNRIKTEDVKKAIDAAQENMDKEVRNNETLINSARKRAKDIIESYIEQMNKISGKNYEVTFLELKPDKEESK